jgi:tRNA-Thr(GGU) m(6)t(6)A37 methyltransferase TsaA
MIEVTPIGHIKSPWSERFGIPRQASLAQAIKCTIVLDGPGDMQQSLRGLSDFSHIWILFHFHETKGKSWKPIVRPPRLGGKEGRGVFATRSPFRPNPIGLSAVKLLGIHLNEKHPILEVEGGDFLDGTPVLDIKPYVPYADQISSAQGAWASDEDPLLSIVWQTLPPDNTSARYAIERTIALDPRPAWERGLDGANGQSWGVRVDDFEVRWSVKDGKAVIFSLESCL